MPRDSRPFELVFPLNLSVLGLTCFLDPSHIGLTWLPSSNALSLACVPNQHYLKLGWQQSPSVLDMADWQVQALKCLKCGTHVRPTFLRLGWLPSPNALDLVGVLDPYSLDLADYHIQSPWTWLTAKSKCLRFGKCATFTSPWIWLSGKSNCVGFGKHTIPILPGSGKYVKPTSLCTWLTAKFRCFESDIFVISICFK